MTASDAKRSLNRTFIGKKLKFEVLEDQLAKTPSSKYSFDFFFVEAPYFLRGKVRVAINFDRNTGEVTGIGVSSYDIGKMPTSPEIAQIREYLYQYIEKAPRRKPRGE